jgi:hypothetical protein
VAHKDVGWEVSMAEFKEGDLVRYHRPPAPFYELKGTIWIVTRIHGPMNCRIEPVFGYDGPDKYRTTNSAYIEKLEALEALDETHQIQEG